MQQNGTAHYVIIILLYGSTSEKVNNIFYNKIKVIL